MKLLFSITTGIFSALALFFATQSAIPQERFSNQQTNEKIPVLMYHHISRKNGRFTVTPENFRTHLKKLYAAGYSTVSMQEILENRVPKNKKSVILTFDDGYEDNFEIKQTKECKNNVCYLTETPKKDCAYQILQDFYKQHKDFGRHAIFFISFDKIPFGQQKYVKEKLEAILKSDMEIGNHTNSHAYFRHPTKKQIDEELGKAMEKFSHYITPKQVYLFAFPGGFVPKDKELFEEIKSFNWEGKTYQNKAAFTTLGNYYRIGKGKYRIPRFEANNRSIDSIIRNAK